MRIMRRTALAVLGTLLLAPVAATSAQATEAPPAPTSYRYWGYYQWTDAAWTFATAGPADTVPADGATEGWRFAVTDESSARFPRVEDDMFGEICSGDPAAGNKQVAVVIDYGTPEDSADATEPPEPLGACAEVPSDASGADVLAAVAEVRLDPSGLSCGLDGYPAAGCGDPVEGAAPTEPDATVELALPGGDEPSDGATSTDAAGDSDEDSDEDSGISGSTWTIAIAIAAIVLIGLTALIRSRRTRTE